MIRLFKYVRMRVPNLIYVYNQSHVYIMFNHDSSNEVYAKLSADQKGTGLQSHIYQSCLGIIPQDIY